MKNSRTLKIILVSLVLLAFASAAYAFAASNTVPGTKAGDGSGTISGYTVSTIRYVLSTSDPQTIETVTFTLDATATEVKIKLDASSSTYYSCTNTSGMNWSCSIAGAVTVADADELQVIAAQ
ncbi:MAG TPA: hypothetical protein VJ436_05105 [Anaerolineales bacterium]|nr:hypothetical protein [Anaerolineales bacterium]